MPGDPLHAIYGDEALVAMTPRDGGRVDPAVFPGQVLVGSTAGLCHGPFAGRSGLFLLLQGSGLSGHNGRSALDASPGRPGPDHSNRHRHHPGNRIRVPARLISGPRPGCMPHVPGRLSRFLHRHPAASHLCREPGCPAPLRSDHSLRRIQGLGLHVRCSQAPGSSSGLSWSWCSWAASSF